MDELLAGDEHPPDDVGVSGNGERFSVRSFQLAAERSALRSVAMLVTPGPSRRRFSMRRRRGWAGVCPRQKRDCRVRGG